MRIVEIGNHPLQLRRNEKKFNREDDPLSFDIIGAAMNVHTELGNGYLENVYQEALAFELHQRNIPFERERKLTIHYKGTPLRAWYQVDFLCNGSLIVELKALCQLSGTEDAQILNYLKATRLHHALMLNFGTPSLHFRRYIL